MSAATVTTRRLKYAATVNDESLGENVPPDYELQYIDIGNVDSEGRIHDIATHRFEAAPSRARRQVRHGDVIISTVRTYLQAIAPINDPPENLIVSTGFAVVRPMPGVLDQGFCRYALREPRFLSEVICRSVGVSYPAINASDLAAIPIPLPPVGRQRAIAAHLDRETSKIEEMIAAKERLLNILAEKRHALITDAVTRGLNPAVPVRSSGAEWLGDIPSHWQTERAKWLFRERDDRSESGSEELLTVSHITGVTPRSEKDVTMFEAETMEGYKRCYPGDLVVNTLWAWMGAMGVSRHEGIVSPAYNVYVPSPRLRPEYVEAVCRTQMFANETRRFSKGVWSSRLRLYPEGLFSIEYPVPPLDEQLAISKHIARESRHTDDLRKALDRSVTILKERRSALIAAAVTGQLDVESTA